MENVGGDESTQTVFDIYENHILRIIKGSKEGDQLLFVTPSTFFGFYSLGANVYEKVCTALQEAKENRRVECQVLIDVRDALTAAAAEGLLSFLSPGKELKVQGNPATYYLLLCHPNGDGDFVQFDTKPERPLKYLRATVRPFSGLLAEPETLNAERTRTRYTQFQNQWDEASSRVWDSIRHHKWPYLKSRFDTLQIVSLFGFFGVGTGFGILITTSLYEDLRISVWVILAYALFSMFIGVTASVIANWITRRGFGRN